MAKELIEHIARALVEHPDQVEVREGERAGLFTLLVAPEDVGRVIGRRGRTAKAIRTVLLAAGDYDVDIADGGEPTAAAEEAVSTEGAPDPESGAE